MPCYLGLLAVEKFVAGNRVKKLAMCEHFFLHNPNLGHLTNAFRLSKVPHSVDIAVANLKLSQITRQPAPCKQPARKFRKAGAEGGYICLE